MATNLEFRSAQKRTLHKLLKLKEANKDAVVHNLEDWISEAEAEMEPEDVALVKEKLSELA